MSTDNGGVASIPLTPERPLEAAARAIIERERARLPRFGDLIVVLPNLHAAGELGRALQQASGLATLLLPRFSTLAALAGQASSRPRLPPSRRQSLIYAALRGRGWFRHQDLWHVSAELLRLFDELSLSQVALPATYQAFLQQLEQAYRARSGSALQFEARLVHELWHAMSADPDRELDDAALYRLRLAEVAAHAAAPLYAVGLDGLTATEQEFFEVYSRKQPAYLLTTDCAMAHPGSLPQLLERAWCAPDAEYHLHQRASAWRTGVPDSPARQRIHIFGAVGLEHEASAIAHRVGQWLARGKSNIAVVVQDRLVARRARALLERAGVLVADETGWTLSTTSASTVVMRWLDNLDSRFHHQDLLDLLKSPFIFSAWDPARRRHGVFRLEQLLRRHSVVSHLKRYRALASGEQEVCDLLDALASAEQPLDRRHSRPLADWQQALLLSLDGLQVRRGLAGDKAGAQVLQLLEQLRVELAADTSVFRYAEWRQWLNQQLEAAVFRDQSIVSPVVFTHLAACRLRRFDGVIVAGADAAHLPGKGSDSVFFNQAVRAQLGLPARQAVLDLERRDLVAILSTAPETWVTWQERRDGEPNPLSPWFDRLETFHQLAYGDSLCQDGGAPGFHASPEAGSTGRPAPALAPQRVPPAISPSGYNSLVACPYQFYARHALHLNELDEVAPALEKRDYGEYVHGILHRFHASHPLLSGTDPALLESALRAISAEAFQRAIEADFVSHAWNLRWEDCIPGYIRWQLDREQQGWRWREGELARTLDIVLAGGQTLVLRGRLDRVDANGGELAVLDYKTQDAKGLKNKLKQAGEDVQLPCYALLLGEMPRQAAFVAVDGEATCQVEAEQDIGELADANLARLRDIFAALHGASGMPAQGTAQVCAYCEMRGLCRKDYWND